MSVYRDGWFRFICAAGVAMVVPGLIAGCGAAYTPPAVLSGPGEVPSLRDDVAEETLDEGTPNDGPSAQQVNDQDIIIAHDKERIAFFGLFETRRLGRAGFTLFDNTLQWVTDLRPPRETRVFLATYDGTLREDPPQEANGLAVINHLVDELRYQRQNIRVGDRFSIAEADFRDVDVVIYAWIEPIDATNVVRQKKPYLTFSAGQSDELGIGNGEETSRVTQNIIHIYNNGHPITQGFQIGPFSLGAPETILTTDHSGEGVVLMTVEDDSIGCDEIRKFKNKCNRRQKIKMKVKMQRGSTASGSQICIKVDEDCYIWIDVVGTTATATKESEEGVHPIVMGIPNCGLRDEVECR